MTHWFLLAGYHVCSGLEIRFAVESGPFTLHVSL